MHNIILAVFRPKSQRLSEENVLGTNCVLYRTIRFILDFIHRLVYIRQEITTFRRLDLSPSSGGWGKIDQTVYFFLHYEYFL
jgi:hypothetical protein